MGAQAAIEGLARCVKTWPSMGPVVQIHPRRKPPSSAELSCVVAIDDAAAAWQAEIGGGSYALGLTVGIVVPAADKEAAYKKIAQIIDEIAAFRLTMRGQSLDGTDGVVSATWGPLILADAKHDNTALVLGTMNVVAVVRVDG